MTTLIRIDGHDFSPDEARLPVLDRGFLYGDSVYDVIRTYAGKPFMLDEHIARLRRSAGHIRLAVPMADATIREEVHAAIDAAGNDESYVRIVVTRGVGPIDLAPDETEQPTLIVIVRALVEPTDEEWAQGVRVVCIQPERPDPGSPDASAKTGNYLANVVAKIDARRRDADDALLVNRDGLVTEGTTWNVFTVQDGVVRTPSLDCGLLPGLTRQLVLEVMRDSELPFDETTLTKDDVRTADEVFLTSSTRGPVPIVSVDETVIGDGRPGPITQRLRAAYQRRVTLQDA